MGSAQPSWSIAYDVQHRRISFHTLDNRDIRYVDMSSFDFSCQTPVKVLDIQEDLSGNVAGDFIDYTYELNRTLIGKTFQPCRLIRMKCWMPLRIILKQQNALVRARWISNIKRYSTRNCLNPERLDWRSPAMRTLICISRIDLGPLTWRKKSFNRKKNPLKVEAIVPAGLRPGTVPIWVGSCFGEIEVVP